MLLLAAALGVGSGDGRDGATDGRTVKKVPPSTLLRVGMGHEELAKTFGKPVEIHGGGTWIIECYCVGPDCFGRYFKVRVDVFEARVSEFSVTPCP
jgi:hypothetical protein